jgi:3-phosphoshikimate 1-carboxyvinyltransferase
MIEIKTVDRLNAVLEVPGSKSYTHRALIAAALADGESVIENALLSEDTLYTQRALELLGAEVEQNDNTVRIRGTNGNIRNPEQEIYLGNAGTSVRLLTSIAALGRGTFIITGSKRMQERPIQDLLDALAGLGVRAYTKQNNGCPPVVIESNGFQGGKTELKGNLSSQYLSSILLASPYARRDVHIRIIGDLVSKPYVDMTMDTMRSFGVSIVHTQYSSFHVKAGQNYMARTYEVEGDASSACYFWAAAAVTKGKITITNISPNSLQGDMSFLNVLEQMGCKVTKDDRGITVEGGDLNGIEVDMRHMPDVVPTLSVAAAFARGNTVIKNVPHLRIKETDRLKAVATELAKMGIEVQERIDGLIIGGGEPKGAVIETYNDHRMAMSFALAGLVAPGVKIREESCVQKSFPDFWKILEEIYVA